MPNQYSHHVVGGVGDARFLIVGTELSPNISFEDDLTGVSGSSGAYARAQDVTTPFSDYVLTIEDNDEASQEYAEITINTGSAIANRRFIVLAYARNDADEDNGFVWCKFQGLSGDHEKEFTVNRVWWKTIVHEVVVPADASGNNLVYRIYPFAKVAANEGLGKVRIDHFICREILEELELPLPDRGRERQMFRRVFQGKNETETGTVKTYTKGMRYFYESSYERLTVPHEITRTKLMSTQDEILFFPHNDSPSCYFVEWDDDYERSWAFGIAACGHQGNIDLVGTELIPELPVEIIDAVTQYTFETEEYIMETYNDSFIFTS